MKSHVNKLLSYRKCSIGIAVSAMIAMVIIAAGMMVIPAVTKANTTKYDSSFVQNNKIYLLNKTNDGWNDITPQDIPENEILFSTLFINKSIGWAVGGSAFNNNYFTFYRTQNGGKTWEISTVNAIVSGQIDMDFIDEKNGWLLVHQGAAMNKELVTVMRTADGGITWETVSQTDYPDMVKDGFIAGPMDKTGISFLNEKTGWVTGCEVDSGIVFLFKTEDGGKAWHAAKIDLPAEYKELHFISQPPQFFSEKNGILPLKTDKGMLFYSTSDGGNSWKITSEIITPNNGISLYSFYGKYGYFTDGDSIFTILPGSSKWNGTILQQSITDNSDAAKMIFTDKETGWIIGGFGKEYILKTTDMGKHWEKITANRMEE